MDIFKSILSIKRAYSLMALLSLAFVFAACTDAPVERTGTQASASLPCPIDGCSDPDDPPDTPPRLFYPAAGWTVITASEENLKRGVQWWAYLWQGKNLIVKGYYPMDFGNGVPSDSAHVHLTFTAESATLWSADSTIDLPTQTLEAGDATIAFSIDPMWKLQLLNGWDDIDLTLNEAQAIAAFRTRDEKARPWALPRRAP